MRWVCILIDSKALPLIDVAMGDLGVVRAIGDVAGAVCNLSHCFNADNTFDSKIGLVTVSSLAREKHKRLLWVRTQATQQSRQSRFDRLE